MRIDIDLIAAGKTIFHGNNAINFNSLAFKQKEIPVSKFSQ